MKNTSIAHVIEPPRHRVDEEFKFISSSFQEAVKAADHDAASTLSVTAPAAGSINYGGQLQIKSSSTIKKTILYDFVTQTIMILCLSPSSVAFLFPYVGAEQLDSVNIHGCGVPTMNDPRERKLQPKKKRSRNCEKYSHMKDRRSNRTPMKTTPWMD